MRSIVAIVVPPRNGPSIVNPHNFHSFSSKFGNISIQHMLQKHERNDKILSVWFFFTTQYDSAWFRAPLPLSSVPPHCDASSRIYPAGFLHSWVTSPTSPTPFLLSPSWCPPSLCGIPTPSIWLHPSFSPSLTSFPAQVIANRKKVDLILL